MTEPSGTLAERVVLVAEDDYFAMKRLRKSLEAAGAVVLGPAATVPDALRLVNDAKRLDGAVLDINLHGQVIFPVADALAARGVPFVFATGYDASAIPPQYAQIKRCEKPIGPEEVVALLRDAGA